MTLISRIAGGALNFIPVVGPTLSDVVTGTSSDNSRVSKSEFYAYRDNAYTQIAGVYGENHIGSLAGNPFAAFSHGTISDSPLKNYSSEMTALKAALAKYYPSLFGPSPTARQPVVTNDPAPSTDPVPGTRTIDGTPTRSMKIPVWVWILGALLLFGKKLFK